MFLEHSYVLNSGLKLPWQSPRTNWHRNPAGCSEASDPARVVVSRPRFNRCNGKDTITSGFALLHWMVCRCVQKCCLPIRMHEWTRHIDKNTQVFYRNTQSLYLLNNQIKMNGLDINNVSDHSQWSCSVNVNVTNNTVTRNESVIVTEWVNLLISKHQWSCIKIKDVSRQQSDMFGLH